MDQRYIIALELSGSQVKGAAAQASASAYAPLAIPSIEAIVAEDSNDCVQYGRVQNLIDAANHTNYVIQKLGNSPKMQAGKVNAAYVALAGRSLGSLQSSAELSLATEMEITNDLIESLKKEATKAVSADRTVLKVLPRKFFVDNQLTQNPVGSIGSKIKGEFTVVTCNSANRRNLEMVIADRVGLKIKEFVVTPLALADLVLGEEEKQIGCALIDMGAQTTTVSIYKDRALQNLYTLPLGSQNITRDIAKGMNVTAERAEIAKKSQGTAVNDPAAIQSEEAQRINCYVQARLGEIVANIMNLIEISGFKPADLGAGLIITGRGTKLKNFAQYLESQSKMRVRKASIPAIVSIADRSVDAIDYASLISIVAYAAKLNDATGCVTFPEQAPVAETPAFDPFEEKGDDKSWHLDDDLEDDEDKPDKRSERQARKEAERQRKEAERQRKLQEEHDKKEAKEREKLEAQRRKVEERRRRGQDGGVLAKLKNKVTNMITYDPDVDDTYLGDDEDNEKN